MWDDGTVPGDTKEIVEHFIRHYVHENIKPSTHAAYELEKTIKSGELKESEIDMKMTNLYVLALSQWLGKPIEILGNCLPSPGMIGWDIWPSFKRYDIQTAGKDVNIDREVFLMDISGTHSEKRYRIGKIVSFYAEDEKCMEFYNGDDIRNLELRLREADTLEPIIIGGKYEKSHTKRRYTSQNGGQIVYF